MADIAELVARAVQAARRMDRDPDLEGVAHEACLRAITTYDPARCDNVEAWVVYVTKVDAVGYLRKRNARREVAMVNSEGELNEPAAPPLDPRDDKLLVSREDWELLHEKYIERWNFRAIARKREVTIGRAKELVNAAVSRLVQAYFADRGDALAKLKTVARSGRQSKELTELIRSGVLDRV